MNWLQKAAGQGDSMAQNKLGAYYFNGRAIAADESVAAAWFGKAAEQANRKAQENLATLFRLGRGVRRNLRLAYMWRWISVQGSDTTENSELRDMASAMSKGEIADAESSVSQWLAKNKAHDPAPTLLMLN